VRDCSQLDFEIAGSRQFSIDVQASDGEQAIVLPVTVNVLNANEAPQWQGATLVAYAVREQAMAGTVVGAAVADDPDAGTTLSYSIVPQSSGGGPSASFFEINEDFGEVSLSASGALSIDFEAAGIHMIVLRATDDGLKGVGGTISIDTAVNVSVIDVNEAPVIEEQLVSVFENTSSGVLIGSSQLMFGDPDIEGRFQNASIKPEMHTMEVIEVISGSSFSTADEPFTVDPQARKLRLLRALDFEAAGGDLHVLKIRVTDSRGLSDEALITVAVVNSNEQPTVDALQGREIPENQPGPWLLGAVLQASDPDGAADESLLQWAIEPSVNGTQSDFFAIDANTGQLSVCDPSTAGCTSFVPGFDFEEDIRALSVAVSVEDEGGLRSFPQIVTVAVSDLNEAPTMPFTTISVREQSSAGLELSPKLKGADVDVRSTAGNTAATSPHADSLIYSVVSSAGDPSWIQLRSDGVLYLAADAPSFGASSAWNLSVQVQDDEGLTATGTVQIQVVDANFPPTVTSQNVSFAENIPGGTQLLDGRLGEAMALASDQDGNNVEFILESVAPSSGFSSFFLSRAGVLELAGVGFDFELHQSYVLSYIAQDDGNGRL